MRPYGFKSRVRVWLPFGIRRIDMYFVAAYLKALILILAALAALVAIGDLFQRFDDFVILSRREEQDFQTSAILFLRYYATFVPQLIFQYMFPVTMLLAASITATASYAGPRGNNEYIVIRSAGIPVLRSFLPLILPAFLVATTFQATRDFFLPGMVRESNAILNRLRNRTSNPTSVSLLTKDSYQTAAIGWFSPGSEARNLILEVRDPEKFRRGEADRGDNDFVAYRAGSARLETFPDGSRAWVPGPGAEKHIYTQYARISEKWIDPVPTAMTPAMIERQTLGDAVCSWDDLMLLREDNAGARFELYWRFGEPFACGLLIMWGTGICMGRMLRGKGGNYIQAITVSMLAAGFFYGLRLAGRTLWENGVLTPQEAVWMPLAAALILALPIAIWMER